MIETDRKGCKELLMLRMFLAILSSIGVLFFFVSCLILIVNLSVDYTSWLQATWSTVTSFRMWSYFLILASITFLQGIICSKNYLSTPQYLKSRYLKIRGIFNAQNLLPSALYIIIGGVLVWLHLSLISGKYSSLTTDCNILYGTCLVEEHYFLLLSGFWSGLYFYIKTNFFHARFLRFPIIPQSKFLRLKMGIYSMLPLLTVSSLWSSLYFMAIYYFMGFYCRTVILAVMSVQMETDPLDSLPRLISLSLIMHLWLYQLIFILTINSMYLLFEVYLTEWVPFECHQMHVFSAENSGVTLIEALAMDTVPIIQHLAYLDLVTIAQKDKNRRSMLFTLSQPGGHPYNWNCVVEKCVELIKKFSADLSAAIVKPQEQHPASTSLAGVNNQSFPKYTYHMRNLVLTDKVPSAVGETELKECPCNESVIQTFFKNKWHSFVAYILSKPLVHYIFGEQEDGKVRFLLFNCQPVIWAAEAISSLSVLSLSEDSYGIVQKDLPDIITALLTLKHTLDRLQKSNVLMKKYQFDDRLVRNMFTSLRSAIKRSLYRIVVGYEAYITDIGLDVATIGDLQSFLYYRE